MSTATVTRRRLSVGVPSFAPAPAAARAPCSPITNEHPHAHTATKPPTARDRVPVLKKIRSFTSMLSRSPSPAPAPGPTKKELKDQRRAEKKKQQEDFASAYGSVFASEVALLQLLDGGSTTRNIERVHKAHAKAAARHGQHHAGVAAGAVRGPHGELFASAQDESERRGLVRGGYERSRSKRVHHADEDEAFYSAEEDAPAWAGFQPRQRSNTARAPASARDAFFAESFAPPMPARLA